VLRNAFKVKRNRCVSQHLIIMPFLERLDFFFRDTNRLLDWFLRLVNHPLVLGPYFRVISSNFARIIHVVTSMATSIVMNIVIIERKDWNLLICARQGILAELVVDFVSVTHGKRRLGNCVDCGHHRRRKASALTGWIEAHQFRVSACNGAIDICALDVELVRVVIWAEKAVVMHIALSIMTS